MKPALARILVCWIFLSFVVIGFSAIPIKAYGGTEDKYALVFFHGRSDIKPMLSGNSGVSVIDEYSSFSYVKATEGEIQFLRNNNVVVEVLPEIGKVRFDTICFDSSSGEPTMPAAFRAKAPAAGEPGYYIVQMRGPPRNIWLDSVESLGAQILDTVNCNGYIVKMKPEVSDKLAQKDFVSWIGLYHPYYKLRGDVEKTLGVLDIQVVFFKDADFAKSLDTISSMGSRVTGISTSSSWWNTAWVLLDSSLLPAIAAIPDVWFIEPTPYPRLIGFTDDAAVSEVPPGNEINNDLSRWVIQSGINGSTPVWDHGIHGEGIIVGIGDGGVDYDHNVFTNHSGDQGIPGPGHRKIERYWAYADNWDDGVIGHGTFCAASVAGNNIANPGLYNTYDGMAYMAKLAVADIGLNSNPGYVNPPPMDELFGDAASHGALSHTDSWGSPANGAYDSEAQALDQYMWDNPNYLAFFGVGNLDSPGTSSIFSPATAKSVVGVGASLIADQDGIAYYSCRGPTADGRIKPDIVAPGKYIISALSDGAQNTYNSGYCHHGGTSMACPIAAGAAALVEQYFKDGFYPSGQKNAADGFTPSGPLRKAILVNSGKDLANADARVPDNSQGWGRVTLDNSLYFKGDSKNLWVHDDYNGGAGLHTGDTFEDTIKVNSTEELKVTLVWNDWPGSGLRNNLNLMVTAPNGDVYIGNNYNNGESVPDAGAQPDANNTIECVYIKTPQSGTYTLDVTGAGINSGGAQKFALVASYQERKTSLGVTLNHPNKDETIFGGTAYNINWTSSGGTPPVTVELQFSGDGGQTYNSLVQILPASGEWAWSVPSIDTTIARIKVIATDLNTKTAQAESGNFTISTVVPEFPAHFVLPAGAIVIAAIVMETRKRKRIGV